MFFIVRKIQDLVFPLFNSFILLICITCILNLILPSESLAQQPSSPPLSLLSRQIGTPVSNQRVVNITVLTDTLVTDSLTIEPTSVRLWDIQTNQWIDDSSYIKVKNSFIILKEPVHNSPLVNRILRIIYRVLPFDLSKKYFRLDESKINSLAPPLPVEFEYGTNPTTNTPIFEKGLEYNGNYTQGLSLGNAQNLVVNQNFNLNLAGKLGDLDILASMTDNNLPIQAEGNTQSLREIDKIFIQLKKDNNTLIAGDYENNRPSGSYFLNYAKKVQGLSLTNKSEFLFKKSLTTTQTWQLSTKANIGISRGKFARNILPAQEGNQGPYKLFGTEGGTFFIILSGTEKVFFDGKLLVRGDENDYIIDYNRGDISFTPKRLVTKDSRIVVEFEYADQSYLRSMASLSNELKLNVTGTKRIVFNFYSEQDSKNSTGTQTLDSLDKTFLRRTGNDFDKSPPLSIRSFDDGFRSDRVQYRLIDTIVNNKLYSNVLVYSTQPDSARFTATFTPVGEGKGNYIQIPTAVNGRVYQWVAPDNNGILRGSFEPIKKLVPPNQQQMMSLGFHYDMAKNSRFFTEIAMSNNDRNRFSTLGDSANVGLAVYSGFENQYQFGKKQSLWTLKTILKTEIIQKNFKPLNPYRAAEFTRDWNIGTATGNNNTIGNLNQNLMPASELWLTGGLALSQQSGLSFNYDYSQYNRQLLYKGQRHAGRLGYNKNNWQILAEVNKLNTASQGLGGQGGGEKSDFSRPKLDIAKTVKNIKFGVYAEREKNQRTDATSDTLTRASFYYDLWRFYAERGGDSVGVLGLNFSQRFDYQPVANRFFQLSKVNELNVNGIFNKSERSQLSWNMAYRDLRVADTSLTTLKPQQTYLGRLEYGFNAYKNAIYGNTLYEIGSGQEQRLEYQYIRVNKGEGQYIWRNRNNDTIPQLDEFEVAPFSDQADYTRVTLLTNQFIRTNNVTFSQSLRFDPRAVWFEKKGLAKFMSRFSTNSALIINRRVKNDTFSDGSGSQRVSQWNPFQVKIADSSLVALTVSMRNSLFFNRSNAVWDIEIGQLDNRNRIVLVTGFEQRGRDEWFLRSRLNLSQHFSLQNYFAKGQQSNNSEAFINRNYTLSLLKAEPELTWMLSTDFRFVFSYKYKKAINLLKENGESLKNNDISTEITWNQSTNAQFRTKFSFVQVNYVGERNTPIEFAMLEGLQNGKNFLWNVSLDRVLSSNIFLNISYEGRKTGAIRTVHVGRAAVRANF